MTIYTFYKPICSDQLTSELALLGITPNFINTYGLDVVIGYNIPLTGSQAANLETAIDNHAVSILNFITNVIL